MNIEKKFINGLRVTDKDSINIVAKVLSDEINQELSEMINSFGGITININKDSEKILLTEKISSQIDLGYVGQIKNVDTNFLINALQSNYIPVIAPLGFNENNEIFNIQHSERSLAILMGNVLRLSAHTLSFTRKFFQSKAGKKFKSRAEISFPTLDQNIFLFY